MNRTLSLLASAALHGAVAGAIVAVGAYAGLPDDAATISVRAREEAAAVLFVAPLLVERTEDHPLDVAPDPPQRSMPEPPSEGPAADAPARPRPGAALAPATPAVRQDVPPVEMHNPPPVYPALARRRGWEGEVVVAFDIREDGSSAGATVVQSSGHDCLDDAALKAVREWRYRPARRDGRPVTSSQRVRFHFRLQG